MSYAVGQRWVCHSDPALGLGIVTRIDGRLIEVSFPACEEVRLFAADSAPLTRIEFSPGDTCTDKQGQTWKIQKSTEHQQRLIYQVINSAGEANILDEVDLGADLDISTPQQRLYSAQTDSPKAYQLRYRTLLQLHSLQMSKVRGLLGSRTDLLPHQVYLAQEIASRHWPRVMLCDEVGLGKTIEAGMILHAQLYTGRTSRALILVPDSLIHQWFVEMLRRFNLHFSIYDLERFSLLQEEGNPFDDEQLIICPLSLLVDHQAVLMAACQTQWDMLIVDEAHHLHVTENSESDEFSVVKALSACSHSLLLLSATPEQDGDLAHFKRLQLLDPDRFHHYQAFCQEQQQYRALSELIRELQQADEINPRHYSEKQKEAIRQMAPELDLDGVFSFDELVRRLIDQHGTGRIFFRNTRNSVGGFPIRCPELLELPAPDCYQQLVGLQWRTPENFLSGTDWLTEDSRVGWLVNFLKKQAREKILLICEQASTALALEDYLHLRQGIRCAAFHEGLSIVERDRAAAWFAEKDNGAQLLICSEIGSEGRNFQFAHHLVLFDLPLNPDLLEQRIGRLDRIGQCQDIRILVPYFAGTAQEILVDWYHLGLNLFQQSCAVSFALFQHFEPQLLAGLADSAVRPSFWEEVASERDRRLQEAHVGRDLLIEMNSCRFPLARQLIEAIRAAESPEMLAVYFMRMLDVYGVDYEEHSENSWILHPTEQMRLGYFPGLQDDSLSVTFDRQQALEREDFSFLTWEHPMVTESMTMLVSSELGNTTVSTLKLKGVPVGTLLLECWAAIHCRAPRELELDRFLPLDPLRLLVSSKGQDLSHLLSAAQLDERCETVSTPVAQAIIKEVKSQLQPALGLIQKHFDALLPEKLVLARGRVVQELGAETERLVELRKFNPSIRQTEIDHARKLQQLTLGAIDRAQYQVEAIRLIVSTQ